MRLGAASITRRTIFCESPERGGSTTGRPAGQPDHELTEGRAGGVVLHGRHRTGAVFFDGAKDPLR